VKGLGQRVKGLWFWVEEVWLIAFRVLRISRVLRVLRVLRNYGIGFGICGLGFGV
jgi:hypothetical protein